MKKHLPQPSASRIESINVDNLCVWLVITNPDTVRDTEILGAFTTKVLASKYLCAFLERNPHEKRGNWSISSLGLDPNPKA